MHGLWKINVMIMYLPQRTERAQSRRFSVNSAFSVVFSFVKMGEVNGFGSDLEAVFR